MIISMENQRSPSFNLVVLVADMLGLAPGEGATAQEEQRLNPHGETRDVVLAGDIGGTNSRFMLYEAKLSLTHHSGQK